MNTPFHSQTAFRLNPLALLLAACALIPTASQGQTLISYNFNSLSNGNLVGQDSWALGAGGISPTVANTFGSQALANASTAGNVIAKKSFFTAGDVSTSETVTLEFDAARTTSGGTNLSVFGIGTTSTTSAYFGLWASSPP